MDRFLPIKIRKCGCFKNFEQIIKKSLIISSFFRIFDEVITNKYDLMKRIFLLAFILISNYTIGSMLVISQSISKDDGITIRCGVDTDVFDKVEIQRKHASLWETISVIVVTNPIFTYTDYTIDNRNYYEYRLRSIDSNGIVYYSNIINNILISVQSKQHERIWVMWNTHKETIGDFGGYLIYRSIQNEPLQLITTLGGINDTIFIDETFTISNTIETICYQIRAKQLNTPVDFPQWMNASISRSEMVCIKLEPKLLIPTAFNPNSSIHQNKTFGVNDRFVSEDGFKFTIYDRWGKLIFNTNIPNNRWDGHLNGKIAPIGVYTYDVTYKTKSGVFNREIGTFTLIR